ncbi:uncharacterized protein G2W53_020238 [Senna tora]|uniref:Uncharacterized protein n=1 Tax=Senna tora TaxID=362788 RepID=A0A834TW89_9FABA|nr:uncharacterized protein G2W53_020238 [Senna tora]
MEEVIDLTASPPRAARILKIEASTCARKIQFKIKKASQNSSPSPRHNSRHTFEFYEINEPQAQSRIAAVYKPPKAFSEDRQRRWSKIAAQKVERRRQMAMATPPPQALGRGSSSSGMMGLGPPTTLKLFPTTHPHPIHIAEANNKTSADAVAVAVAPNNNMPSHQLDLELRLASL